MTFVIRWSWFERSVGEEGADGVEEYVAEVFGVVERNVRAHCLRKYFCVEVFDRQYMYVPLLQCL